MEISSKQIRRFWFYVDKKGSDECWPWLSAKTSKGYGLVTITTPSSLAKQHYAHRIAYILEKGPIPSGMQILHKCDNPCCVNPNHLSVGTVKQNLIEAYERNRIPLTKNTKFKQLSSEALQDIATSTETIHALARKYGVAVYPIRRFRKGLTSLG